MDDIRPRLEAALAGTYSFERELGGGGMSRTYLVREDALHRRVVVKVLAPELLAGISVERFRREVLLAAQLQHPHVVAVLTAGDVDGIPWFSMPYVEGDSLRQRLARGPIGINEAVSILRDVARALAYAHARGIVHRDIKPDNVLLSSGSATVTDFGIAKALAASQRAHSNGTGPTTVALTQVGTSIGTPAYMSPEQAAGDPGTDHRADLYSFGVLAFEMLAGRPPFVATTPTKLLAAHMTEIPPDLLTLRPDCPQGLAALIMSCLAKEPDDRPRDASELVAVLDTITSSGSGVTVPGILRGGNIRLHRALGIWAVATALVGLTAWAAREAIGLPDWVLPGAVGVMLAGLPMLLLTAFVQRTSQRAFTATPNRTPVTQGTMATLAMKASPHISWRRTWLGGFVAVGGFALLVIGFMVMRALGIGPMASLQGKGEFGATELLMVADFGSPPSDSTLGATVAEALRTDLAQSSSLGILTRSVIRERLSLLMRSPDERVPFELARQIATSEGAKAVLDGQIVALGKSYVITARLVSALDGNDLATFRVEAANEDEILPALGELSKEIRVKAGESLKTIRASSELERVTTPSLPALRKYVEGARLADEEGEPEKGMEMIREAVALDSGFAMAWRKLAVLLNNERTDRQAMIDAISTAYRHRDRLTEMERLLTEGFYFSNGPTPDRQKALAAYQEAMAIDTLSTAPLNNAAILYEELGQFEKAEGLYRRVVALPHTFGGAFTNLIITQIHNGRSPAAIDSTVARFREKFQGSNDIWEAEWYAAWAKHDWRGADSIARSVNSAAQTLRQTVRSSFALSSLAEIEGRIADAKRFALQRGQATVRADSSPGNLLGVALDSVYYESMYGSRTTALALLAKVRSRIPMERIPPSERPWPMLQLLGATLYDPRVVEEANAGIARDLIPLSKDPEGRRAFNDAMLAYASKEWNKVIPQITLAERQFAVTAREANVIRGMAFDRLGQLDSAIVYYERFLRQPDADTDVDAPFRATALEQLGAAYEAKGNAAKAVEVYSEFVDLWAKADPMLQPRVADVRARIDRLRGEIG